MGKEPYFNGEHKLSGKQVRKIVYGRWREKSNEFIIKKIKRSEKINNIRIGYHMRNKEVLENDANYRNILIIRLAVLEDVISGLRRDKLLLRKRLEGYDYEREKLKRYLENEKQ